MAVAGAQQRREERCRATADHTDVGLDVRSRRGLGAQLGSSPPAHADWVSSILVAAGRTGRARRDGDFRLPTGPPGGWPNGHPERGGRGILHSGNYRKITVAPCCMELGLAPRLFDDDQIPVGPLNVREKVGEEFS
ncbi:hypothetical protein GCM10018780_65420 [Streptomyces lanatus]|nr:hypothetical protein GCM10018780_65420 [Streptomyces lanatus]